MPDECGIDCIRKDLPPDLEIKHRSIWAARKESSRQGTYPVGIWALLHRKRTPTSTTKCRVRGSPLFQSRCRRPRERLLPIPRSTTRTLPARKSSPGRSSGPIHTGSHPKHPRYLGRRRISSAIHRHPYANSGNSGISRLPAPCQLRTIHKYLSLTFPPVGIALTRGDGARVPAPYHDVPPTAG